MAYVRVEVDVDDVIDAVSDEMLLAECKARDLAHGPGLLEELRRADPKDFLTIAERILAPKWPGNNACLKQYNLEMGR